MVNQTLAAGVIEDAPTLASLLMRVLTFLLEVFGIVAILGIVVVGIFYLFVTDEKKGLFRLKQVSFGVLVGVIAVLGALVVFRQIMSYF